MISEGKWRREMKLRKRATKGEGGEGKTERKGEMEILREEGEGQNRE